jgi:hypothetical protein
MGDKVDPKKYREMCEPHKDAEAAQAALEAFGAELYELRCKHRIADVFWVGEVRALVEDGAEVSLMTVGNVGNDVNGAAKQSLDEALAKLATRRRVPR